jgi:hypothetical protein
MKQQGGFLSSEGQEANREWNLETVEFQITTLKTFLLNKT